MRRDDWQAVWRSLLDGRLDEADETLAMLRRHLYWTARAILGRETDAEDAVAETFYKMIRHGGQLRHAEAFPAWVRTVLVNECRRLLRRRPWVSLEGLAEAGYALVDEGQRPSEVLLDLERLLARLSPSEREVLTLKYLHDLTVAEIAETLGVPEGTVKSRLSRALAAARTESEEVGR
jgi:RNA polymerase sigma factor (sigma-70 family)